MYPPVFSTVSDDAAVQFQLGTNPTRFYPFGQAPAGVAKPYAVWQVITGLPQNYMDKAPDIDSWTVQVDVYADSPSQARDAAEALRDAIEPVAHIVAWRGEDRDPDTKNYRLSFDADWWESRANQS